MWAPDIILYPVIICESLIIAIATVRDTVDRIPIVAGSVKALKNQFTSLIRKFRRSARNSKIDINDLTSVIKTQLASHGHTSPGIHEKHIKKINSLRSTDEYFDYLEGSGFLGYLNYDLLGEISEIIDDNVLVRSLKRYQSSYKRLLKNPSIQELMQVFIRDPSLHPTSIIGLPEIVFDLDNPWPERSAPTWDEYLHTRFPWASSTPLQAVKSKCVRLRYAVLPCVYDDVVKDVHDECVVAELKEINITIARFTEVTFTERVEMVKFQLIIFIISIMFKQETRPVGSKETGAVPGTIVRKKAISEEHQLELVSINSTL